MNLRLVVSTCACLLLMAACARSRPQASATKDRPDAGAHGMDGASQTGTDTPLPGAARNERKDAGTSKPPQPTQARCGDGIRQDNELCDSPQLSVTCRDLGFESGELSCSRDCMLDTSMCVDSSSGSGGTGSGGMGGGGTRG